jgi:hypothetical protein
MSNDLTLDKAGDLAIHAGDFIVDDGDAQHIQALLMSSPGDWKQSPLIGVSLGGYLLSPITAATRNAARQKIQLHLEADGFTVQSITVDEELSVNVYAERK